MEDHGPGLFQDAHEEAEDERRVGGALMVAGMPMRWQWVCAAGSGSGSLVCVYWGPVFGVGVYRGLGLAVGTKGKKKNRKAI